MALSWLENKKQEIALRVEASRYRRDVKRYAKLQAQERLKYARETGGAPGIAQRFSLWFRQRAPLEWLQARRQRQEPIGRKSHQPKLLWIFTLFLASSLAGYLTYQFNKSHSPTGNQGLGQTMMATVNGKPIYLDSVRERVFFAYGPSVLPDLVEQEVVRQEAEKQKVRLTSQELVSIQTLIKGRPQKRVLRPRLEALLLSQSLVSRKITDERRREVFSKCRAEVSTYHVSVYSFADKLDAIGFATESRESAKRASQVSSRNLGGLTPAALTTALGRAAAKAILSLRPGELTSPIADRNGQYVVFRLDAVYKDYPDVQDAIDSLIIETERPKLMRELFAKAKIESPYFEIKNSKIEPTASLLPEAKATPAPSPR